MGYGSYQASDWVKLKESRKLDVNRQTEEVFTRTSINPKFDPRYIGTRECFDSEDHPHTTPIVVGLDVTGSMGYLAVHIATGALNDLITKLYSTGDVEDPALMCAAYGDYMDRFPLQVTQFEADIRIAEQLLDIYFENKGSGQVVIPCLWEFLARHTNIDAINKRHEKGFLFTIGDAAEIRENAVPKTIKNVIGDDIEYATREELLREVEEKFHVVHIMIGNAESNTFMNGKTIKIGTEGVDLLPEIIIGAVGLLKGKGLAEIADRYDEAVRPVVMNALRQLMPAKPDGTIEL